MTESPLQFHNERQFELEFKLHEAEQKVEQLNLQLKGKSMQLEQVQVRPSLFHGTDKIDDGP